MRRQGIGAVAVGAVLLVAAVAGFVIVPEHRPGIEVIDSSGQVATGLECAGAPGPYSPTCHEVTTGPSRPVYDALRIATWALAIVGVVLVVMGLIGYARPEVVR